MADPTPAFATELPVRTEGGVVWVDLNRPDEGNALNRPMLLRLTEIIRDAGRRPETNLIAIGARGAFFCRGRDARGEAQQGMTAYDIRQTIVGAVLGVYEAIRQAPVPVVAVVQGSAVGFGAALASACDITLASDAAKFSFTEIENGIPPTLAISAAMANVPAKAMAWLIYSAREIDAQQAATFGIASTVLPAAGFGDAAGAIVRKLGERPRLVVETIKRYQQRAAALTPEMRAEYAGDLLALVRTAQTK